MRTQKYYMLIQKAFVNENGQIRDSINIAYALSPYTLCCSYELDFQLIKGMDIEDYEMAIFIKLKNKLEKIPDSEIDFKDALEKYRKPFDGKSKRVWVINKPIFK